MAAVIHYKFKNVSKKWETINFEKPVISVLDIKRAIVKAKNLNNKNASAFDLLITNAQTGEDYVEEGFRIPKNSSVIIRRVPATRARSLVLRLEEAESKKGTTNKINAITERTYTGDDFGDAIFKPNNKNDINTSNLSEMEKAMMKSMENTKKSINGRNVETMASANGGTILVKKTAHGAIIAGRQTFVNQQNITASTKPYAGYKCNMCGSTEHYIKFCPLSGDPEAAAKRAPKKSYGIPKTFMKEVENDNNDETKQKKKIKILHHH